MTSGLAGRLSTVPDVRSVLRTQRNVKPVFVSVGHAVGLDEACDLVLRLSSAGR
jgi:deoxyribonuclease V